MADGKEFAIEILRPDQSEEIAEFINKHFLPYETLERGLHATKDDLKEFHSKGALKWISSGVSICALHKASKTLAGICLNMILSRSTIGPFEDADDQVQNDKERILTKLLLKFDKEVNIFEDPEVKKVFEIVILTVDKEFSGKGVSYKLIKEAERLAKEKGCQILYSQATGHGSQHILSKCNFKTLKKIDLAKMEINGKKVIDTSATGGVTHVIILSKDVKDVSG